MSQTSLGWNKELLVLEDLLRRLVPLEEGLSIVLNSLMDLYQEHYWHAKRYKYGPMDTAAAYMALKDLMEAGGALDDFRTRVDEAAMALRAMSGDLYYEQEENDDN